MNRNPRCLSVAKAVFVWAVLVGISGAHGQVGSKRLARLSRGINASHWFSQVTTAEGITDDHLNTHTTDEDIALIEILGFDHIRLSIEPELMFTPSDPAAIPKGYLAHIDRALDMILDRNLAVIVDIHPGVSFRRRLGWDDQHAEALAVFWGALANHLSNRDAERVFFEVLNEPMVPDPGRWGRIQARAVREIRRSAPRHTIIVAGRYYSSIDDLLYVRPLTDRNVVYNFHMYEPTIFTHQGADWGWVAWKHVNNLAYPPDPEQIARMIGDDNDPQYVYHEGVQTELSKYGDEGWGADRLSEHIGRIARWAAEHGVRLTCNEFGVFWVHAPAQSRAQWIRDARRALEKYGIGWTHWDYAGGFGVVFREDGHRVPKIEILDALGLISKVYLREDFSQSNGQGGGRFWSGRGVGAKNDWDWGLVGESAYVSAEGSIKASAHAVRNGGASGQKGDHAGQITIDSDPQAPGIWEGGLQFNAQSLPSADMTEFILTADVLAKKGGDYQLRIESSRGNWIGFDAKGTGRWQAMGGVLAMGTQEGRFDPTSSQMKIVVVFGNDPESRGDNGVLSIDNIKLARLSPRRPVPPRRRGR